MLQSVRRFIRPAVMPPLWSSTYPHKPRSAIDLELVDRPQPSAGGPADLAEAERIDLARLVAAVERDAHADVFGSAGQRPSERLQHRSAKHDARPAVRFGVHFEQPRVV